MNRGSKKCENYSNNDEIYKIELSNSYLVYYNPGTSIKIKISIKNPKAKNGFGFRNV